MVLGLRVGFAWFHEWGIGCYRFWSLDGLGGFAWLERLDNGNGTH